MTEIFESAFSVGAQPCNTFRGRDELVDRGVRGNRHSCYGPWPQVAGVEWCAGLVSFCEACVSDHHQNGWDTCPVAETPGEKEAG